MIQVQIYKARKGAQFPQEKAQEIGEELEKIKENAGILTAEKVLENARDNNSVLHSYFQWDTDKAAYQWNLHQARMIINSIEVTYVTEDVEETCPKYINIKNVEEDEEKKPQRAYVSFEEIGNSEFLRQQALKDALQQLNHWKEKYKWLEELSDVVKEIEKLNQIINQ